MPRYFCMLTQAEDERQGPIRATMSSHHMDAASTASAIWSWREAFIVICVKFKLPAELKLYNMYICF